MYYLRIRFFSWTLPSHVPIFSVNQNDSRRSFIQTDDFFEESLPVGRDISKNRWPERSRRVSWLWDCTIVKPSPPWPLWNTRFERCSISIPESCLPRLLSKWAEESCRPSDRQETIRQSLFALSDLFEISTNRPWESQCAKHKIYSIILTKTMTNKINAAFQSLNINYNY